MILVVICSKKDFFKNLKLCIKIGVKKALSSYAIYFYTKIEFFKRENDTRYENILTYIIDIYAK